MTEPAAEDPTDDSVADGTQLPTVDDLPAEEGDACVNDAGTEEWYEEGED